MTPRDRFIAALERRPLQGRVPHFELVFFLTMEAFRRVHPCHRNYEQWLQMTEHERQLHRNDMADIYIATARKYDHSAILIHPYLPYDIEKNGWGPYFAWHCDEHLRMVDALREMSGDEFFLMAHGDVTYSIPSGTNMAEQTMWFCERLDEAKENADRLVDQELAVAERFAQHGGLDGFALCSDYCLNNGPFLSPEMFSQLVAPYLARLIAGKRELGFYVVKHTDGNIMPILDQLIAARPHALHSLDPQGGVDIAEVKRLYGNQVCLIGNVASGLLSTGADDEIIESARYCIRHGMPGSGYIFSTSNCVFTGLPLERYELMWKVWHEEAIYS